MSSFAAKGALQLLALFFGTGGLSELPAHAAPGDSLGVRWEVGATTDMTNELFVQEAYSDTTFLARQLIGDPEVRTGAVLAMQWGRPLASGTITWTVRPDLILGDKVRQFSVVSQLRRPVVDRWSWSLEPRLKLGEDLGFGFRRSEFEGVVVGRARRELGWARDQALEFRAAADLLQVLRDEQGIGLTHYNGMVGAAFERMGLGATELRLDQRTWLRTFPDSTSRDHFEQQAQLAISHDFGGVHALALRLGGNWRSSLREAASSRDRFALLDSQMEWTLHAGLAHILLLTADAEFMRYALPDSVLDFDYDVLRGSAKWSWHLGAASTASLGARVERLRAPWNSRESYLESAATVEFERFTLGTWLAVAPSVMWRHYDVTSSGSGFDLQLSHSHFNGFELFTMFEQVLPGGIRVRGTGIGRAERHDAAADDARSLYFSLDVRRLF